MTFLISHDIFYEYAVTGSSCGGAILFATSFTTADVSELIHLLPDDKALYIYNCHNVLKEFV